MALATMYEVIDRDGGDVLGVFSDRRGAVRAFRSLAKEDPAIADDLSLVMVVYCFGGCQVTAIDVLEEA